MGDRSIVPKFYSPIQSNKYIGPNIGERLKFDTCEQSFSHDNDYVHVDKLSCLSPTLIIVTKTN